MDVALVKELGWFNFYFPLKFCRFKKLPDFDNIKQMKEKSNTCTSELKVI